MKKKETRYLIYLTVVIDILISSPAFTQTALHQLQQQFIDLRFGMFIHFNIPTFMNQDWPDPEASPAIFNPKKLDCNQWALAARSANMTYGCLTTKHHSGFCIWNTQTTEYSVMNSPLKRDVVKEFADAFRSNGLKVMLYYSILDIHHKLRPGYISRQHIELIKKQLTELLTNYGEIRAIIFDGWDAPWSRISYDDIPFGEIYSLVKKLQPNCLVMDLNAAKYPSDALFYTDIKSYEQNAGQNISKEANKLPALSCLPINNSWFWKKDFPQTPVKIADELVNKNIIPLNKVYCNFILNVAPNTDGLIDDNALAALKQIGQSWKNEGAISALPPTEAPVIASNIAKHKPCNSSWSDDMWIMDFANDDDFTTAWQSNKEVKKPWYSVELQKNETFNTITIVEPEPSSIKLRLEYRTDGVWKEIFSGVQTGRVKIYRFPKVSGEAVKISVDEFASPPAIAEFGVYNERR
jgi:alpha-L-fucosidase